MDSLIVSQKDSVRTIKFNVPQRKNAITYKMCEELVRILLEDAVNDHIAVTIVTGVGDYFSSGNDFKSTMKYSKEPGMAERINKAFQNLTTTIIDYPKIIIAVVNGPAIGIGATLLGLFDIVYASDTALFDTPFIRIGLSCEGCSSLHFLLTMGRSKASETLLLAKKMTAQEAERYGLISKVIPHEQIDAFIAELHQYGNLPVNAIKINKKLIVDNYRGWYHECYKNECSALEERLMSDEFKNNIANLMKKKSKI